MSGQLTTHVLDTAHGKPAAGMTVTLLRRAPKTHAQQLKQIITNADGRADGPLLERDDLQPGDYELRFHVADYYAARQHPDAGRFLTTVPVVFRVDDPADHYHVPLLVTPWSYSTDRGS